MTALGTMYLLLVQRIAATCSRAWRHRRQSSPAWILHTLRMQGANAVEHGNGQVL